MEPQTTTPTLEHSPAARRWTAQTRHSSTGADTTGTRRRATSEQSSSSGSSSRRCLERKPNASLALPLVFLWRSSAAAACCFVPAASRPLSLPRAPSSPRSLASTSPAQCTFARSLARLVLRVSCSDSWRARAAPEGVALASIWRRALSLVSFVSSSCGRRLSCVGCGPRRARARSMPRLRARAPYAGLRTHLRQRVGRVIQRARAPRGDESASARQFAMWPLGVGGCGGGGNERRPSERAKVVGAVGASLLAPLLPSSLRGLRAVLFGLPLPPVASCLVRLLRFAAIDSSVASKQQQPTKGLLFLLGARALSLPRLVPSSLCSRGR